MLTASTRATRTRVVTIILPEFIPARWWQQMLHNQTALLVKGALLFRKNVVLTDVPYLLQRQCGSFMSEDRLQARRP